MKDLKKKTFYIIFLILSLFSLSFAFLFNFQVYRREYNGVKNSITSLWELINQERNFFMDNPKYDDDLKNHMIMDYEVYTFILDRNNHIIDKISHSNIPIDDKVIEKAESILAKSDSNKVHIGSLYFSNYAYNLNNGQFLTIVRTKNVQKRLMLAFLTSVLIVSLGEILIYIITKKITEWITKPVEESFNKQKEFVVNASHELKTPLAVMIASIDCLEPSKKNEKWINNLKSESERMNRLITRLLDLAKSEDYLLQEDFKVCNISKIIEKRALTFESLAYEKKISIETEIAENINFLCNSESIDELITILIDNALSHSEPNNAVTIKLVAHKNEISIEVINKGEAIKKEDSEKIFERFYRSDKSRNRNDNRYGLGLSIAKNIVESHNGLIKAYSSDGYTTFKVIFKTKNIN